MAYLLRSATPRARAARALLSTYRKPAILEGEDRTAALEMLPGWQDRPDGRDAIARTFDFSDFKRAWAFMSAGAMHAEENCHHPEWSNVYSRVEVVLTTHDAGDHGGLSKKDLKLAMYLDEVAAALQ
jgi:4a-hydroxytetrahydrobiopterin dehydratase